MSGLREQPPPRSSFQSSHGIVLSPGVAWALAVGGAGWRWRISARGSTASPTQGAAQTAGRATLPIPVWVLLAFAVWTVLLLFATVGVYRWTRILTGRVPIREFKADAAEGADWYKRAMRAHANCVENLPVLGALVFVLYASGTGGKGVDVVSLLIIAARVCQSLVHVCLVQTNAVVSVRFSFFLVQAVSYLYLAGAVVGHVLL